MTAAAVGLFAAPAGAHFAESPHDHPNQGNIKVNSPAARSTVSTVFTLTGENSPGCDMEKAVYAYDGTGDGLITTTATRNGSRFSYVIDTTKVVTFQGQPYTLKSGLITIHVKGDTADPDCDHGPAVPLGSTPHDLILEHPGTPPAPQAEKRPAGGTKDDFLGGSSPSPNVTPLPAGTEPASVGGKSFWDALAPQWWMLLGVLGATIFLIGAELTARRYHRGKRS